MESKSIIDFLSFKAPTAKQLEVLRAMERFIAEEDEDDFMILCGSAGTGKTSLTAALVGLMNNDKRNYRVAAPTGRAARILGRKANITASTIHSLIYIPKSDPKTGQVVFKLKQGINRNPTVYIIDEASMIPKTLDKSDSLFVAERGLIFDLIDFIKKANNKNKIIFLGDRYQLPPIGEKESFALNKTFLETTFNLKGSEFYLTEVKRQENGSYILENANQLLEAIDLGAIAHPISGKQSANIHEAVDHFVAGMTSNGLEHAIAIAVSHKANMYFNKLVRDRKFGETHAILEPGELLMVNQNWSRKGKNLFNGDQVELLQVDLESIDEVAGFHFAPVRVKLLFSQEEVVVDDYALLETIIALGGKIDSSKENELRRQRYIANKIFQETNMPADDRYVGALRLVYGYSITCNKAQGGEWPKIFINTLGIPSLRWQYTAITRGIDEIESFGIKE